MDFLPPLHPTGSSQASVDLSLVVIISLGAVCALLLIVMVMFAMARCGREKADPRHNYNCRVAESSYQNHPKKPSRQIHKADITLIPTVNGTLPVRSHPHSTSPSPTPEVGTLGSRQSHHSRQSLNSLVTISSNHVAENFALELAHATPPVEGQYQPRPSFRGNKYTRSYRYALNEMDKFSLKDSGRGDSEAGDSDYEPGRESPLDRLLGEGFSEGYVPDGQHRPHAAMRHCTEECRVLGHSDQCWMPPLTCPASSSSDYRSNLYIPGEEAQIPDQSQEKTPLPCTDTGPARGQSFSTFGKEVSDEECGDDNTGERGGGGGGQTKEEDLYGTSSLLTEMSSVFQRLLPQGLDSYIQVNENQKTSSLSGVSVPMTGSLDRRRGHLPGKPSPSAHQQGVAAWAANTHFQNPSSNIGPSGHHQGGSYHTLKPSTKLSCQSSNLKNLQAPKNSPVNSGHTLKVHGSPMLTALVSPTLVQSSTVQAPMPVQVPGASSKWLPAMEEIPENYEEDDFDSVLSHLQGKRSDSRHELVDASELVAEINKLLQDVRQS